MLPSGSMHSFNSFSIHQILNISDNLTDVICCFFSSGLRQRKPVLSVPQKELSDITLLSGKPSAKSAKQIFQMDEISDLVS